MSRSKIVLVCVATIALATLWPAASGAVSLASAPEPAAWALMFVGLAALGATLRISRRALP